MRATQVFVARLVTGLFQQAGIEAIICGPGEIGRAHRPDEFIETGELAACQRMIEALGARLVV